MINMGANSQVGKFDGTSGHSSAGQAVAMSGAVLISLPMIFAGMKLISDATVIRHNIENRELRRTTLSPGKEVSGFVYFQLPDKDAMERSHSLEFSPAMAGGGGSPKLETTINIKVRQ